MLNLGEPCSLRLTTVDDLEREVDDCVDPALEPVANEVLDELEARGADWARAWNDGAWCFRRVRGTGGVR